MNLPTNFQDDLLDTSQNTTRVYDVADADESIIQSNVHLVEKTVYTQRGTELSAQDINNINTLLNAFSKYFDAIEVVDDLPSTPMPRTLYMTRN